MTSIQRGIDVLQKRVAFTPEEDKSMWNFFMQKIRKGNSDAIARRASIWSEYAITSGSKRTYQSLEKHFRSILLPRIDDAPIDDEDVVLILGLCNVTLRDNDARRNLKRRLRKLCELTIDLPSLVVKKVTRLEMKRSLLSEEVSSGPPSPSVVPDTQIKPEERRHESNEVFCNEEANANVVHLKLEEDLVNGSFHSVDPDEPVEGEEEYIEFAKELSQSLQETPCEDFVQSERSPMRYYARRTTKSSSDSSEYMMDISGSPVLQREVLEEQIESDGASVDEVTQNKADKVGRMKLQATEPTSTLAENADIHPATQTDLDLHMQLTEKNKGNPGITPAEILQYKKLLRLRIKLVAEEKLPVDSLLDGMPNSFRENVGKLVEMLKWCLTGSLFASKSDQET